MANREASGLETWGEHRVLATVCVLAVCIGIYARFAGLGAAPFAPDEFFLARSIENLLQYGVPRFDCGGLYTRGLALQYLSAPLQLAGLSGELAPRLLCAISSLLTLPAVYLIARRAGGIAVGLAAVTIMALSVWEVEMARFGRMYAPFQTVFTWYVVFFLRFTVDGDRRAIVPMLLLTVLGPLTWEGGVFIALANLLPPFLRRTDGRLDIRDFQYLALMLTFLAASLWFVTADFRIVVEDSPWPPGYDPMVGSGPTSILEGIEAPFIALAGSSQRWMLAIPLAIVAPALLATWKYRSRPITFLALLATVAAAATGQLLLAVVVPVLVMVMRLVDWRELLSKRGWPWVWCLSGAAAFWLLEGYFNFDWRNADPAGPGRGFMLMIYALIGFPDFGGVVALPWARAVPFLALGLLALISLTCIRLIHRDEQGDRTTRILVVLLIVMLLGASASNPPRFETRYVFFLYPLTIITSLWLLTRLLQSWRHHQLLLPLAGIGLFSISEDFSLAHFLNLTKSPSELRSEIPESVKSHLIVRNDSRAVAKWLAGNVDPEHDFVVNAVQGLDHYYHGFDAFFVDWRDLNLADYSCRNGQVDRWSNLPLIYRAGSLRPAAHRSKRVLLVIYDQHFDRLRNQFPGATPVALWSTGSIQIFSIDPDSSSAEAS